MATPSSEVSRGGDEALTPKCRSVTVNNLSPSRRYGTPVAACYGAFDGLAITRQPGTTWTWEGRFDTCVMTGWFWALVVRSVLKRSSSDLARGAQAG
jgi:hypothetical protein